MQETRGAPLTPKQKLLRAIFGEAPPRSENDDGGFVEDPTASAPSDVESHHLLKEQVADVLSVLTPVERKVLELRFGLEDGHSRSFREVGELVGLSASGARGAEKRALATLKHPTRSKKPKDYLD